MSENADPAKGVEAPKSGLARYAILVSVGAFATTFAQQKQPMLGGLPTNFLLKDGFGLEASDVAYFFFWAAFAWNLKPVAGILTDAFPIFGTRRRHYMMIGATAAGLLWGVMGTWSTQYGVLFAASILMNCMMVLSSTVMGGMMVEAGQAYGAPGRMASLRQVVSSIAQTLAPAMSGYLVGKAYGVTAGIAGGTLLLLAAVTYFVHHEKPGAHAERVGADVDRPRYRPPAKVLLGLLAFAAVGLRLYFVEELSRVGISLLALEFVLVTILLLAVTPTRNVVIVRAQGQLTHIFESRSLWLAVFMLFLVYTVPGFNTALFFHQSDDLKFDPTYIGFLGSIEGAVGIIAAIGYGVFCRRFNLRALLFGGVASAGVATFTYLAYSPGTAPVIHGLSSFCGVLAELALMDLAVRSTPKGCEALGFSLMMSIRNFGIAMSDVLGTQIMDSYHVTFHTMVVVNASTTLLVLAFALLLPRDVLLRREGFAAAT